LPGQIEGVDLRYLNGLALKIVGSTPDAGTSKAKSKVKNTVSSVALQAVKSVDASKKTNKAKSKRSNPVIGN